MQRSFPLDSRLVSIQYDPEARVFAVIKEGRASFVNPLLLQTPLPEATHRFISGKDGHVLTYQVKSGPQGIEISRQEEKETLQLELTRELSPRTFRRNGQVVYSIDTGIGKIHFPNQSEYDISEPVYPYQFAIILFSMVDWDKTPEESFVSLYNSGFDSSVIKATGELRQENIRIVNLEGLNSPITLYLDKGEPVKYTSGRADESETFTRVDSLPH